MVHNKIVVCVCEPVQAKADGFLPGGASLHSCMTPHGPDTKTYEATISRAGANEPFRLSGTLAFMFESSLIPRVCRWALDSPCRDLDYYQCWIGLKSHFSHDNGVATSSEPAAAVDEKE
jgi:homogentisate 1,2-dioxygenase